MRTAHLVALTSAIAICWCAALCGQGQDVGGIAVLFDNSGSMVENFTWGQMDDAQKLVTNLLFEGSYESSDWEVNGLSIPSQPLWQPGRKLYVHCFGELESSNDPFFRNSPEDGTYSRTNDAKAFLRAELLDKIDFEDNFTHIQLAKSLCWYDISRKMGADGRGFYMQVLLITDDEDDEGGPFSGAGLYIDRAYSDGGISEVHEAIYVHRAGTINRSRPDVRLRAQLLKIGPHFIEPEEQEIIVDSTKPKTDYVKLTLPNSGSVFKESDSKIDLKWENRGDFDKFVIEIRQREPSRSLMARAVSKARNSYRVLISEHLMPKVQFGENDEVILSAKVRGVYPEHMTASRPVSSREVLIKLQKEGSAPWGVILPVGLGVAGLAGFYFLYSGGYLRRWWELLAGKLGK